MFTAKYLFLLLHQSNEYFIQFHVLDDQNKENESLYTKNENVKSNHNNAVSNFSLNTLHTFCINFSGVVLLK